MAVSLEVEARVRRLFHAEKWKIGTIARELSLHPDAVRRILAGAGVLIEHPRCKLQAIDAYRSFITETWKRHPTLTASRLYRMCKERGYCGGPDHFRHQVRSLRPRPRSEAFLRLRSFPAEQAQVDWGHFGKVTIGRATRPLMAFVMVLSWSRQVFLRFYLGAHSENFLRGHEAAFAAWGGVARRLLYDNLKSAVLERQGDILRFHPELLRFAGLYCFEPRAAAPYRGNEKGRVERAIRMIRSSFWPARQWRDLDDLNVQALQWCEGEAGDRPWAEDRRRTVREAFAEERGMLLPLPGDRYPTEEQREVAVPKTPYVRFDRNDYSVPRRLVRRVVAIRATLEAVRVFHQDELVATHRRSFDAGAVVEDPAHVKDLVEAKRAAREHRGQDRLARAVPEAPKILEKLAQRNENLGSAVARFLDMLQLHGAPRLRRAMRDALARDTPHPRSVRHLLETRFEQERGDPPVAIALPPDERVRGATVRPHSLASYDDLGKSSLSTQESDADSDADVSADADHPNPPETNDAPHEDPS